MNRRNILAAIGLAPVTTAAMAIEDMRDKEFDSKVEGVPGLTRGGPGMQDALADRLEDVARAIRAREIVMTEMSVHSQLKRSEWMSHVIQVTVELPITPGGQPRFMPWSKEQ